MVSFKVHALQGGSRKKTTSGDYKHIGLSSLFTWYC